MLQKGKLWDVNSIFKIRAKYELQVSALATSCATIALGQFSFKLLHQKVTGFEAVQRNH